MLHDCNAPSGAKINPSRAYNLQPIAEDSFQKVHIIRTLSPTANISDDQNIRNATIAQSSIVIYAAQSKTFRLAIQNPIECPSMNTTEAMEP